MLDKKHCHWPVGCFWMILFCCRILLGASFGKRFCCRFPFWRSLHLKGVFASRWDLFTASVDKVPTTEVHKLTVVPNMLLERWAGMVPWEAGNARYLMSAVGAKVVIPDIFVATLKNESALPFAVDWSLSLNFCRLFVSFLEQFMNNYGAGRQSFGQTSRILDHLWGENGFLRMDAWEMFVPWCISPRNHHSSPGGPRGPTGKKKHLVMV